MTGDTQTLLSTLVRVFCRYPETHIVCFKAGTDKEDDQEKI